jgi:hypothetical protein
MKKIIAFGLSATISLAFIIFFVTLTMDSSPQVSTEEVKGTDNNANYITLKQQIGNVVSYHFTDSGDYLTEIGQRQLIAGESYNGYLDVAKLDSGALQFNIHVKRSTFSYVYSFLVITIVSLILFLITSKIWLVLFNIKNIRRF